MLGNWSWSKFSCPEGFGS